MGACRTQLKPRMLDFRRSFGRRAQHGTGAQHAGLRGGTHMRLPSLTAAWQREGCLFICAHIRRWRPHSSLQQLALTSRVAHFAG